MVELSYETKVVKTPICYRQTTVSTYPKENVKNMVSEWKKGIEQHKEFLDNYEEQFRIALENGEKQIDLDVENKKKKINELESMSKDELTTYLLDQFEKELEKEKEFLTKAYDQKKELRKELDKQFKPMKQSSEQKVKELKEALKLWENPIVDTTEQQ